MDPCNGSVQSLIQHHAPGSQRILMNDSLVQCQDGLANLEHQHPPMVVLEQHAQIIETGDGRIRFSSRALPAPLQSVQVLRPHLSVA